MCFSEVKHLQSLSLIALCLYALLIAWLSLSPGSDSEPWFPHDDKLMHFIAYGLFAMIALPLMDSKARMLIILCSIVLFGGGMELGQKFVPLRQMSFGDFAANTLGVFWGLFLSTKLRAYSKVSNSRL